jgi:hypothetical protein
MNADISARPPSSSMNCLVEPRLVDLQVRIGQQAVAIEPLDVVALVRAAVGEDVDAVFLHGADDRRRRHGAAERRRVVVGHAGGRDVERAGLQRGDSFGDQLGAAVYESSPFCAVLDRATRDRLVVVFVGLAEVGRVRIRDGAFDPHPVQRGTRVESAGERDANFLAGRKTFKDCAHVEKPLNRVRENAGRRERISGA